MTKFTTLFLIVLVVLLLWIYFDKDSGHDREMQALIEQHNKQMEASRIVAEKWKAKAGVYFQAYSTAQTKAMKAEQRFNYMREQNEILKRKIIRYNNASIDSLFIARYGN